MAVRRGIRILIDTREKRPLLFPNLISAKATMKVGDYALHGYSKWAVVEYKSLGDWVHWINPSRTKRFDGQLTKLSRVPRKVIVVGGRLGSSVPYSRMGEDTIMQRTAQITVWYGIPVVFCSGRRQAAKFITNFLLEAKRYVDAIAFTD